MVKQGRYVVQLVEAARKTPFKEHHVGDKCYAEVEPDVEYFIRVLVLKGKDDDEFVPVVARFIVDGKSLGYFHPLDEDKDEEYIGHWNINKEGTLTEGPLLFERHASSSIESNPDSEISLKSITVRFYENPDEPDDDDR